MDSKAAVKAKEKAKEKAARDPEEDAFSRTEKASRTLPMLRPMPGKQMDNGMIVNSNSSPQGEASG